jgi:hypothetical protein
VNHLCRTPPRTVAGVSMMGVLSAGTETERANCHRQDGKQSC